MNRDSQYTSVEFGSRMKEAGFLPSMRVPWPTPTRHDNAHGDHLEALYVSAIYKGLRIGESLGLR